MLDCRTHAHHHVQPGFLGAITGSLVDDAQLHPNNFGAYLNRFVDDK